MDPITSDDDLVAKRRRQTELRYCWKKTIVPDIVDNFLYVEPDQINVIVATGCSSPKEGNGRKRIAGGKKEQKTDGS